MINCPSCKSLLVFPRDNQSYCEDCGWPEEDFNEVYEYPKDGEQLSDFQPGLEFYSVERELWFPSGIISSIMRNDNFRGLYRYLAKPPMNDFD